MGVQEVRWDKGGTVRAGDYDFFYRKGNENHQLGTGFLVHCRIVSDRREGDHWGDLGVDGWIILGWICRRWDVGIWTGLGWPRIETGVGRL